MISRRHFLRTTGVITAAGAAGSASGLWRPQPAAAAGPAGFAGQLSFSMAMHVHGPFSEGTASMEAHLQQAAASDVDVIWWTEHDQRMSAHRYRRAVHFDALTEAEDGSSWTWAPANTGSVSSSFAGIVTSPASPRDTHAPGAMRLLAVSAGATLASRGFLGQVALDAIRTSLDGQVLEIDVFPIAVGPRAYLDLTVETSHRPARQGRTAGRYSLSYRVGGGGAPGSRVAAGRVGVVTLAAPEGQWTTLRVDPAADLAAIYPGVDGRDSGMYKIVLKAVSAAQQRAEGVFDLLTFERNRSSGNLPLQTQAAVIAGYAPDFPSVRQHPALEVSLVKPHLGWYGGTLSLPDHTGEPATPNTSPAAARAAVDAIHAAGGVASYNHPFEHGGPFDVAKQESLRRAKATQLIGNRALGCDALEVGYRGRGGVSIERHLSVWDACSRNAIFLTGTGVSDDHAGTAWLTQEWNFLTWAWSLTAGREALVDALRAGRAYFGDPARFRGQLDLLVDGTVPMGAVSVSTVASRTLDVIAIDVPSAGTVEIVRGAADRAGAASPDPVTSVTTLPAAAFSTGSATVNVDTRTPCFVRTVVRDGGGLLVAASNPVWLLRAVPPTGIPVARRD